VREHALLSDHNSTITSEPDGSGEIERLMSEGLIPLGAIARELDRDIATLIRWTQRGTLTPAVNGNRTRVRLEHLRLGGAIYTTRQALARYIRAMTSPSTITISTATTTTGRTPAQRRRESAAAAQRAAQLGC
jgi:hypothetical protein